MPGPVAASATSNNTISDIKTYAIIGGAGLGGLFVAIVIGVILCRKRRNNRHKKSQAAVDSATGTREQPVSGGPAPTGGNHDKRPIQPEHEEHKANEQTDSKHQLQVRDLCSLAVSCFAKHTAGR